MSISVFISKGSTTTKEQREFVDAILNSLDNADINSRIMNENEWSHEQPLRGIKKIIQECDGAVIIAFTRTSFLEGLEYTKNNEKIKLTNIKLSTTWNHIEAALAYSNELPLLVIAENGLKEEGLIEDGYDWRVYWSDIDAQSINSDKFKGFLKSWKKSIEENIQLKEKQIKDFDIDEITIGELIKGLKPKQLWATFVIFLTIIGAISTFSYKLGTGDIPILNKKDKNTTKQIHKPNKSLERNS